MNQHKIRFVVQYSGWGVCPWVVVDQNNSFKTVANFNTRSLARDYRNYLNDCWGK
jgi:hypothetical protein